MYIPYKSIPFVLYGKKKTLIANYNDDFKSQQSNIALGPHKAITLTWHLSSEASTSTGSSEFLFR